MPSSRTPSTRHRVVFVAFDEVQALDVTGPMEVFSLADRAAAGTAYAIELVSPHGGSVRTSSGLRLTADADLHATRGPIDTLVVAGGLGTYEAVHDEALISWLRLAARRSRRVTSVCTGAFLLARAGLLDGRRATTHWASCAALQRAHPSVGVDPDPIFVRDGNVYTAAGVTAGIDLALALVEEDLGARPRSPWPERSSCSSVALAGRRSSAPASPVSRPTGPRCASFRAGSPTTSTPTCRSPRWRSARSCRPRNFARVFAREVGMHTGRLRQPRACRAARERCSRRPTYSSTRSRAAAVSARWRRCVAPSAARCT